MSPLPLRVIDSEPGPGAWNMAVDEALLHVAAERGGACLRTYAWSPATLSLGYFQRLADRETHRASRDCEPVRRASGGGAILHDRELTYSLTVARDHPLAADAEGLYRRMHQAVIDVLAKFGVAAEFHGSSAKTPAGSAPFLCYQRRTSGDLVLEGEKIVGSAQRRHRGAILQHGSILLARSDWAPELPGIREISGVDLAVDALAAALVTQFAQTFQMQVTADTLSEAETSLAEQFLGTRYGSPRWTALR